MAHIMDQLSEAVAEAHNYKKGYERLKEENQKLQEKGYPLRRRVTTLMITSSMATCFG